jgi:hypothetical protein
MYLPADPFGLVKNRSVILSMSVDNTPEAREFLRSVKSITPPENSSKLPYLLGAAVAGGLLAIIVIRRR